MEGERNPFAVLLTVHELLGPLLAIPPPGEYPTPGSPTGLLQGQGIGQFALEYFSVPAPRLVRHVLARIVLLIPLPLAELVLVCGHPLPVPIEAHKY